VGVRKNNAGHGLKTLGAKAFYAILNKISEVKVIPGATDFRLIDRAVINEFNRFTESNRMTRALIDWLGFRRAYIYFDANERLNGEASYSLWKLTQLAFNGFISLSMVPLKLAGYFGAVITLLSGILGVYILLGKYIFHWYFAYISSNVVDLAVFTVFLVGIILISLGFISFYIANIQKEVIGRPMYVIRKKKI
ncbi:MAG: glycosyltransferase, partial [Candidatus Pacebacteria bacterium]|nr:glycosyltransferase [Candidatus Paceibacterota bacterium]